MRSLLVLLTVLAVGGTAGAQPANDACGAATSIRSLPFTATIDTTAATVDLGDPHLSCSGAEDASV